MGKNPLICVGVNPSTAEPNKLDNTIRSVDRIAARNGYDSWIMLNLCPQRATNPNEIDKNAQRNLMTTNFEHINALLTQYSGSDIWAAWGTLIEKREYLRDCLTHIDRMVQKHQCRWVSIGNKSKKGHPHHPLYLKTTSTKEVFDIAAYKLTL